MKANPISDEDQPYLHDELYGGMSPESAQRSWEGRHAIKSPEGDNLLSPEREGFDEPPLPAHPDEPASNAIAPTATFIPGSAWPDGPPPPQRFVVRDRLPCGDVSTFDGDGGLGKTQALLQLAAAVARDAPDWLGMEVQISGEVVFISAEEPEQEMWRRLYRIARRASLTMADFEHVQFWFPPDIGDTLFARQNRAHELERTPLFEAIAARINELRPALVAVDNVAAIYGGEQNNRTQARAFINFWRAIAHSSGASIVLANHPSLSGLNAGTGRGGSMDWRNSVRSALHLKPAEDKEDADRGIRVIECVKSNYAPKGQPTRLEWVDGILTVEGTASPIDRAVRDAEGDRCFLALLDEHLRLGFDVSPSTGRNYAPLLFSRSPNSGGYKRDAFAKIMHRLLTAGTLIVEKVGPPSREKQRLVRTHGRGRE